MRRAAPRVLLPLMLLPLFLLLTIGPRFDAATATDHATTAPLGSPMAARVHAQGEEPAEGPVLIVAMYAGGLYYRTLAFSPVTAELSDGAGFRSEGGGFAGGDGWAEVGFIDPNAAMLPGYTVTLTQPGGEPLIVQLPEVAAAIDTTADRIFGRAPANAAIALEISPGGGASPLEREVSADGNGDWSLDLAGDTDLVKGAALGIATYADGEGHLFRVNFVDLAADVALGGNAIRGRATPGGRVEAVVTRAGGQSETLGPAQVASNGGFLLAGASAPLMAGDQVELRIVSQPVAAAPSTAVSGTLEALTILLDPAADQVGGSAPVSATVSVVADSLSGEQAAFETTADASGAWLVDTDDVDLGAGWRAQARVGVGPGLRVSVFAVVEQLRLGVGIPLAQGRAMPGQPVTVTLRAADGAAKRVVPAMADDQGSYQIFFDSPFSPSPVAPQPGERVEIAFVAGDPVVLIVPPLSAVADADSETVAGETDPGAVVRVRVDGAPSAATAETTAAPDGRYTATFADYDLSAPATGSVEVEQPSGNVFYTTWAAVRLTTTIGNTFQNSFVTGTGAPFRRVHVELLDPEGRLVAEAEGPVFSGGLVVLPGFIGSGAQFFLQPTDITGAQVQMEEGDTLRVTIGDAVIERQVPPLDAVVLVQRDAIAGQAAPNARVRILVSQTPPAIDTEVEVTADAEGNWAYTWDDGFDLLFGDQIQLFAESEGHDWLQFFIAPGLLLDADQSVMLGSLSSNAPAIVALARDGETLFEERTQTDNDGALFSAFFDDQGQRIVLNEGDEITVLPLGRQTSQVLRLTVPKLDLFWDVETDAVGGNATAGGSLIMLGTNAYARTGTLGINQAWPTIGADDRFTANFVPAPDVRPGTRLIAIYRPESGNYVVRQRTVPILNAEIEGPNACGFGKPDEEVSGDLATSSLDSVAAFDATARFDGYFAEAWLDEDEVPLATHSGFEATVGLTPDEPAMQMTLPGLELAIDWQSGMLTGTGPADTDLYLGPALPCTQQQAPGVLQINVSFPLTVRTDGDGKFQSPLGNAFGGGIEVGLFDEGDHRAFRQVVRPQLSIFLGEDKVEGRAGALAALGLRLLGADGSERGATSVVADVDGAFLGRLVDGASEPVLLAPGDTLRLESVGQPEDIVLENVDFDWSPGAALVDGSAPAGRTVVVALRLNGGGVITINRVAGDDGRFSFGENDVPPRAAWSMDSVAGVRVILPTVGGHLIVRQTTSFEGGGGADDGRLIFLPAAYNASAGAAAVQDARSEQPTVGARSSAPIEIVRPTWRDLLGHAFFDPMPRQEDAPWLALPQR